MNNNNDVTVPVPDDENYNNNNARPTIAPSNSTPQTNKIHSYSQQLRARHHHIRKHSLDEDYRIAENIDHYYDDSSDDDDFYPSSTSTSSSARIENAFLYDNDCVSGVGSFRGDDQSEVHKPMPEFIGNGGGVGMFKVPMRAAVHPASPPFLELRPHPLKETQVNRCLRTIECTETQLWAGQENGVRFWNFEDSFEPGCGLGKRAKRGDEDAAPFRESCNSPPTFCLIIDSGKKLVWTGHKDGKIRSWKMDKCLVGADKDADTPFKEGLSWQAHQGPVLSMVFTSYGDIWSGGEGGVIKIWPWETIEKSLSMSKEEKHMAALLVERSFIDLKTQVTVNGVCGISSQDVKCLLVDSVRAKVWCAYPQSFSLWDARTRELSKVFNIDGQIENRIDTSPGQDQAVEDEIKEKKTSASKKEKPHGFLQRSRNALKEATGFVRRAATKGTFVEDNKRTEALVVTVDGMIWSGCTNGLLVQWDGNGNRLRDILHHPCGVLCFCTSGTRIYVGYVSGMVQILDLEGNLVAGWIAHGSPVIKLVVGSGYIFSLATHGGIRGWHVTSPGPLDNILRSELVGKEATYTRKDNVNMLIGTWNVGEGKASLSSLQSWLGSASSDVGIVVVGLQEVEMGAGFLAMSAAKETVGIEGSIGGQLWLDTIGKALDEGTTFERMGSRQLAGLLISLWVRKSIRTHVGDVDAGAVACGFGRAIGNKGAVGLRIRVYNRIMCFVNCHYAAHLEAVNRRNADFNHVYRNMAFTRSSSILNNAAVGVSSNVQVLRGTNAPGASSENTKSELTDADMVVFLGDFNYRLHSISYDEARDFVSQRCFDWLREKDQLRAEMKAGKVFQGMREAVIRFPPTYKFEKRKPGLAGYDSGEKKRIPAWCDRILYRDNRSGSEISCSLECPVISSILQYEACMDVLDSDHKPVRCKFHVQICHVDRSVRRHGLGKIIKSNKNVISFLEQLCYVPETCMSTENISLQNREISHLQIINKCKNDKAIFIVFCEGQSTMTADGETSKLHLKASFGFPRWLVVTPASGIIDHDQSVEISVQYEDCQTPEESVPDRTHQQTPSSEDTRDKEVMLVVNVRGSCSTESTNHRVKVRHWFTEKTAIRSDSKSSSTNEKNNKESSVHQHDKRQPSCSSDDVSDDTRFSVPPPDTTK